MKKDRVVNIMSNEQQPWLNKNLLVCSKYKQKLAIKQRAHGFLGNDNNQRKTNLPNVIT